MVVAAIDAELPFIDGVNRALVRVAEDDPGAAS